MYECYKKFCEERQATGKYRILPEPGTGLDFSTNDYLGLSDDPRLIQAATEAAEAAGVGSTGSRLLSGNHARCVALEAQIARDKGTEAALLFNTGFQANSSVLASLLDPAVVGASPLVFFDRLNHASLYQGVALSCAQRVRYQHCDMDHLARLLEKYRDDTRPRFIVSETVFGMDGDIAPMSALLQLARRYRAFVYLDEAHATGVVGRRGFGLSPDHDLSDVPSLVMGTFSKALGCQGAYVACASALKEYLVNHCAGFIYSTALSPMLLGAMQAAWQVVEVGQAERDRLHSLATQLRAELQAAGWNTGHSCTQIIPLIMGREDAVMQAKDRLLEQGIRVSAVRPPTVPPGTARLRIALTARHTELDVATLLAALRSLSS